MAKPGKMAPEERAERLKREREFQELLEKRKALDESWPPSASSAKRRSVYGPAR